MRYYIDRRSFALSGGDAFPGVLVSREKLGDEDKSSLLIEKSLNGPHSFGSDYSIGCHCGG